VRQHLHEPVAFHRADERDSSPRGFLSSIRRTGIHEGCRPSQRCRHANASAAAKLVHASGIGRSSNPERDSTGYDPSTSVQHKPIDFNAQAGSGWSNERIRPQPAFNRGKELVVPLRKRDVEKLAERRVHCALTFFVSECGARSCKANTDAHQENQRSSQEKARERKSSASRQHKECPLSIERDEQTKLYAKRECEGGNDRGVKHLRPSARRTPAARHRRPRNMRDRTMLSAIPRTFQTGSVAVCAW